ncbi:hypothetical protein V3Q09_09295 [Clostridioides difficile]|uniref:hypothetical protein n=1 Tax=Clostridioides difficile TaxID=1496 RepID=UPI001FAE71E3|nr:hypothetical protein [Clostridioides difficile]MDB0466593.1 hypothetical protein [Clostridioides difficile]HDF2648653.1 hypothetical protein [Clostridioides difficile]
MNKCEGCKYRAYEEDGEVYFYSDGSYEGGICVGDTVILQSFKDKKFTGIEINKEIEYFVKLGNGYVELGIK